MRWIYTYSTCLLVYSLPSWTIAQQDSVWFTYQELSLDEILLDVASTYKVKFSYNPDALPSNSKFTYTKYTTVQGFLDDILTGTELVYSVSDKQIIIKRKPELAVYSSIRGRILSKNSKEPIEGVSIYIDKTTLGTVSDAEGYYYLAKIPQGVFTLVISSLGYKKLTYRLPNTIPNDKLIDILLEENIIQLNPVEIKADIARKSLSNTFYNDFKRDFLGFSSNSLDCMIENPEVIILTEEGEKISVETWEPLIITNEALGYINYYDLSYYVRQPDTVYFLGTVRFQEILAETNRQQRKWLYNRRITYQGSLRHFFISLQNNQVRLEGFRLLLLNESEVIDVTDESDQFVRKLNSSNYQINFQKPMLIVYMKEKGAVADYSSLTSKFPVLKRMPSNKFKIQGKQWSILESITEEPVIIDHYGTYKTTRNFTMHGQWSRERVADLLPLQIQETVDRKRPWRIGVFR